MADRFHEYLQSIVELGQHLAHDIMQFAISPISFVSARSEDTEENRKLAIRFGILFCAVNVIILSTPFTPVSFYDDLRNNVFLFVLEILFLSWSARAGLGAAKSGLHYMEILLTNIYMMSVYTTVFNLISVVYLGIADIIYPTTTNLITTFVKSHQVTGYERAILAQSSDGSLFYLWIIIRISNIDHNFGLCISHMVSIC